MHIDVPAVKVDKLTESDAVSAESSIEVREGIQKARDMQTARFKGTKINANSELTSKNVKQYCILSKECTDILRQALATMHLSGRSYFRTIKANRTIADLEGADDIQPEFIAEALRYRPRLEVI